MQEASIHSPPIYISPFSAPPHPPVAPAYNRTLLRSRDLFPNHPGDNEHDQPRQRQVVLLLLNYDSGEMTACDGPSARRSTWFTLLVGIDLEAKPEDGWFGKNYWLGKCSSVWKVGGVLQKVVEIIAVGDVVKRRVSMLGVRSGRPGGLSEELVWDFLQTILQRFGVEYYLFTISFKMEFRDDLCDHVSDIADTPLAMEL